VDVRESMVEMLEKLGKKNDYMILVTLQLKIKSGYYINCDPVKRTGELKTLTGYVRCYPHISTELRDIISYIEGLAVEDIVK
jgi:hypothetical protein